jgi:hypothetical protein
MDGLSNGDRTVQEKIVKITLKDRINIGGKINRVDFRGIAIVIGIDDRLAKGARPLIMLVRNGESSQHDAILHHLHA